MNNKEKYNQAFINAFSIDKKKLENGLEYNSIPEWDSIGHMTLISELEQLFKISIEMPFCFIREARSSFGLKSAEESWLDACCCGGAFRVPLPPSSS